MLPLVTGCAMTLPISGTKVYCAVTQPITWSSKDTEETKAQVQAQNATYDALCG